VTLNDPSYNPRYPDTQPHQTRHSETGDLPLLCILTKISTGQNSVTLTRSLHSRGGSTLWFVRGFCSYSGRHLALNYM